MSTASTGNSSLRANLEIGIALTLMLIVGLAGWHLRDAPKLRADTSPLSRFPKEIGRWQALDQPMDAAVEKILNADFHLQRAYVSRTEDPLWLYVGYYGTRRGGRPEHTPRGCYTGAGWGIEATQTLEVGTGGGTLRANEYRVERDGAEQLVQFWYRTYRRSGLLGGLDQNIDRMVGLLTDGRADGALVRISTPIRGGDVVSARSRLLSFASMVDPLLGEYWPRESPCEDSTEGSCGPISVDDAGRG